MKYAKGVCWVDDTRIPFVDVVDLDKKLPIQNGGTIYGGGKGFYRTEEITEYKSGGRFTPSLLVCDDMLNDGKITKTTASKGHIRKGNVLGDTRTPVAAGQFGDGAWIEGTNINDKGSSSRFYDLDLWFDKVIDNL